MKKLLTKIFAGLFVVVSGITLFACGDKTSQKTAYQTMTEAIQTIATEDVDHMFMTANVDSVRSDYVLRYYANKSEYNYLNQCLVLPMNYIQKYSNDLERLDSIDKLSKDKQKIVNSLKDSVPAWIDEFRVSVDKYTGLSDFEYAPIPAEGALEMFNRSLYDFFRETYNVAIKLAEIKDKVFNDYRSLSVSNRTLNEEDTDELRDFFVLQIGYDYFNMFVNNLEMKDYSNINEGSNEIISFGNFIKEIKSSFTKVFTLQALDTNTLAILTGKAVSENVGDQEVVVRYENDQINKLFKTYQAIENEKIMLNQSLSNFSLRRFYTTHSCNMDAYAKEVSFANGYYQEIQEYYTKYTVNYIDYLTQIMKVGV